MLAGCRPLKPCRRYFVPNLAALLLGLYAAYYIVLEWFAGLTWTAFVALPVFVTANALQQVLRDAAPLSVRIAMHTRLMQSLLHIKCLVHTACCCSEADGLQPCITRC
jgi:hypothetical protein